MTATQSESEDIVYISHDFWNVLSCLDDRLKVLDYLVNHRSGNYAIGTQKIIAEETDLSITKVANYLKLLQENNIIKKHSQGVYILSSILIGTDD